MTINNDLIDQLLKDYQKPEGYCQVNVMKMTERQNKPVPLTYWLADHMLQATG